MNKPFLPSSCFTSSSLRILLVGLIALSCSYGALGSSLTNISGRANVGTGGNVVIGGLNIQGNASKSVLIRGLGPSLASYFPPGTTMSNPYLELRNANGVLIASNDNWRATQQNQIAATGLAPSNDLESAILISL